jgi:class 3 adenylate cyclase
MSSGRERRVVSVVFCDLVGFTSRSESADIEDVGAFLRDYHGLLRRELERHGGSVEKFIGDAVMALFGTPTAYEDDPERAVRAALAIQAALADLRGRDPTVELHVRIGVNTGEALVTLGARPSEGEAVAVGDVVNTAARIQAAAPVDAVLVGEATYRVTRRVIEYEDRPAVVAKGKSARVPVWLATQIRRMDGGAQQEPVSPLVGRTDQLRQLREAMERAAKESAPQLVALVGVPGIGKSRLVRELAAGAGVESEKWLSGRFLPYDRGVAFGALGEMVKAHAGILHSDSVELTAVKLRRSVRSVISDPGEAAWAERHLRPLVGLDEKADGTTEDRRAEAYAGWRRFLQAISSGGLAVFVFEDVHWADQAAMTFIGQLVEWAVGSPLFILCTARPEFLERPVTLQGWERATVLRLEPLTTSDTESLAAGLLERQGLSTNYAPALASRAEGNPLFAEEFVLSLADSSSTAEPEHFEPRPVPDSVQAVIAARIDTLPADQKPLLQDAAVVGKTVWAGAVAQVAGLDRWHVEEQLQRLCQKQFLRRAGPSSIAGESQYAFHHALIRDVTYATLVRSQRFEKHQAAADWIEQLAGDRSDRVEMVAYHLHSAIQAAPTDPPKPLIDRARRAAYRAADRAGEVHSWETVRSWLEEALRMLPSKEERPRLLLDYEAALNMTQSMVSDEQLSLVEAAVIAAADIGDDLIEGEAEARLFGLHRWLGNQDQAMIHRQRAIEKLKDNKGPALVMLLAEMAWQELDRNPQRAVSLGQQAAEMADELGMKRWAHEARDASIFGLLEAGKPGAIDQFRRLAEAEAADDSVGSVPGYLNYGDAVGLMGDLRMSFALKATARAEANRYGVREWQRWIDSEQIAEWYWLGDWDRATAACEQLEASGARDLYEVYPFLYRARIRIARAELDAAWEDVDRALRFAERTEDPHPLFAVTVVQAYHAWRNGDLDQCHRRLDTLCGYAEVSTRWWELTTLVCEAGWPFIAAGRREDATELATRLPIQTEWGRALSAALDGRYADASALYERIGSAPDAAYARLLDAREMAPDARLRDAESQLRRSKDFWRNVRATSYLREADAVTAGEQAG